MKKVSIKDVAKEAGVSLTTVSHILNHKQERFSQATIDKVLTAKDKLGYIPNKNAQQLRGHTIKLIGVLVPSLTNPFFSAIMQSMEQHKPDYVDLFFLSTSGDHLEHNIKHLVERGMDGLVIARLIDQPESMNNYLERHNVPYVVLDQSEDNGYTDIIRTDEQTGGALAAAHLIDLNHQHIAIVQPYEMMSNMQARVKGFEDYCESHDVQKPLKIETELSPSGGKQIVDQIIDSQVTAVFAINDEMAIGIIRGLKERGKAVPEEISVVGYDNISFSQYMTPALTTVAQPVALIGETALRLIVKKITETDQGVERIELPNELVVRETTQQLNQ
ncbi:LacI family transcriptional regulator [Staphylococcus simulans]|uniref:ribose utilization transcriptional repressor RbsR n=1 Tax=Staphylococcus simulans TaxID=1286 RepID=UPI0021D3178A|nr:LacI family DNA-binding transcriptional regulator [Staphylococcus simulans]UXR47648.1 LacI family transcriptional regulator [Staphylococcus simulans]